MVLESGAGAEPQEGEMQQAEASGTQGTLRAVGPRVACGACFEVLDPDLGGEFVTCKSCPTVYHKTCWHAPCSKPGCTEQQIHAIQIQVPMTLPGEPDALRSPIGPCNGPADRPLGIMASRIFLGGFECRSFYVRANSTKPQSISLREFPIWVDVVVERSLRPPSKKVLQVLFEEDEEETDVDSEPVNDPRSVKFLAGEEFCFHVRGHFLRPPYSESLVSMGKEQAVLLTAQGSPVGWRVALGLLAFLSVAFWWTGLQFFFADVRPWIRLMMIAGFLAGTLYVIPSRLLYMVRANSPRTVQTVTDDRSAATYVGVALAAIFIITTVVTAITAALGIFIIDSVFGLTEGLIGNVVLVLGWTLGLAGFLLWMLQPVTPDLFGLKQTKLAKSFESLLERFGV